MSTYRTGSVHVTNASARVIGSADALWTDLAVGDWFIASGDVVSYQISAFDPPGSSVSGNWELTLSVVFGGVTNTASGYTIVTDFTSLNIPLLYAGDNDTAAIFSRAMQTINDNLLKAHLGTDKYAVTGGSANVYTATLSPAPSALVAGLTVRAKIHASNTGSSTINVNGLGAIAIKKNVSTNLAADDMVTGQIVQLVYDGTNFQKL
jgi:hypothetical protein